MNASERPQRETASRSALAVPPGFAPVPLSVLADAAVAEGPLPEELIRHVVAVAGVAPSVYNTQPWRFRSDGFVIDLFADRGRQLVGSDPASRLLHISCGAALHHARLAIRGLGRTAAVELLPTPDDPDHLARLVLGQALEYVPSPDEWALLQAVHERRTYREEFAPRRLSRGLVVDLEEAVAAEGCGLRAVERPAEREAIARLVAVGDEHFASDARAQEELLEWSRWEDDHTGAEDDLIVDGIPRAVVVPASTTAAAVFKQRDFDIDGAVAATASEQGPHGRENPDVAALFTPGDAPTDWLRAGAALSALLLTATCGGAAASMLNQPLEEPVLRVRVNDALRVPGFAQMLLRIGYCEVDTDRPMTPRRPVDDILTWG